MRCALLKYRLVLAISLGGCVRGKSLFTQPKWIVQAGQNTSANPLTVFVRYGNLVGNEFKIPTGFRNLVWLGSFAFLRNQNGLYNKLGWDGDRFVLLPFHPQQHTGLHSANTGRWIPLTRFHCQIETMLAKGHLVLILVSVWRFTHIYRHCVKHVCAITRMTCNEWLLGYISYHHVLQMHPLLCLKSYFPQDVVQQHDSCGTMWDKCKAQQHKSSDNTIIGGAMVKPAWLWDSYYWGTTKKWALYDGLPCPNVLVNVTIVSKFVSIRIQNGRICHICIQFCINKLRPIVHCIQIVSTICV